MAEKRPYVSWELMNSFLTDAFVGYGVPREDAEICADVLLESDRRGIESHGCNRYVPHTQKSGHICSDQPDAERAQRMLRRLSSDSRRRR